MAITVKSLDVFANLLGAKYEATLVKMLCWFAARHGEVCITSGFRPDGGVHGTEPCRAVDIRSFTFDHPKSIKKDFNQHWNYDHVRPLMKCCVYHNTGRGWHFHIQSHPRTKYIGG